MQIVETNFSESERAAILCALPLANMTNIPHAIQASIIASECDSAAAKLRLNIQKFSIGEMRSMSVALTAAIHILSGKRYGYIKPDAFSESWKKKLAPHFFLLNRLEPIFQEFVEGQLH